MSSMPLISTAPVRKTTMKDPRWLRPDRFSSVTPISPRVARPSTVAMPAPTAASVKATSTASMTT